MVQLIASRRNKSSRVCYSSLLTAILLLISLAISSALAQRSSVPRISFSKSNKEFQPEETFRSIVL